MSYCGGNQLGNFWLQSIIAMLSRYLLCSDSVPLSVLQSVYTGGITDRGRLKYCETDCAAYTLSPINTTYCSPRMRPILGGETLVCRDASA